MSIPDLATRLDRIESRIAIEDLCLRYCLACDDRDIAALGACFTDDVSISATNGSMKAGGREAALAMFNAMFAVRGPGFHWTHDRRIRFDENDADRATGLILAHAETCPAGRVSVAGIRYSDSYRREEDRWLFAARVLDFVYYLPLEDYPARFSRRERVLIPSGWAPADFPEGAESWARWHGAAAGP